MVYQEPNGELAALIEMHREIAMRMKEIRDGSLDQKHPAPGWAECASAEMQVRLRLLRWAPIAPTYTGKALAYLMAISQLAELDQDDETLAFVLSAATQGNKFLRSKLRRCADTTGSRDFS